ncbi:Uncharacterised protein [Chromobacterium violaceum]|uniref:Uncharacterized protein n=1 Tax=Chromobacterium violaceum TaxID=536 RepID=A0A447T4I3_CHRVL|nr:Uncharacterised protein [Chromobacterium violaceum]
MVWPARRNGPACKRCCLSWRPRGGRSGLRLRLVLPLGARSRRPLGAGSGRLGKNAGPGRGDDRRRGHRIPAPGSGNPAIAARRLRSGLQLADPALHRESGWPAGYLPSRAETRRPPGVFDRAPYFHGGPAAAMAAGCAGTAVLAGQRLPGRGPARHPLAGRRRDQAAPHHRHLAQPGDGRRLHAAPRRGLGPSAEQVAAMPELAEERERPMLLLVAAQR